MEAKLIGSSQNIRNISKLIDKAADAELSTVVYGETGVGKELVVQNLYQRSKRFGKPFVKVNCAALPDTLLESEMFGYERGAFTGAERKMRGKFAQADGGVLFLDEIGDMSCGLQAKLLHALQDGAFTPLGAERDVKTDAWVIAATNHDLKQALAEGKFREDLYYRLSEFTIHIKPLRKRQEDIPYLVEHYVKKYSELFKGSEPRTLSQKTLRKFMTYEWPGNVRQLQNALKRLIVSGVMEENIEDILGPNGNKKSAQKLSNFRYYLGSESDQLLDSPSLPLKKIRKMVSDRVDKEIIKTVLEKTGWNRSQASKILNVSYRSLFEKIQELSIQRPSFLG